MSAASERERRGTAGRRMMVLTGQAQEDDEAFWGHDTWAEDDSGNESFHTSDEDSEVKRDVFDSDFDDSETENEEAELAEGESREQELALSERTQKAKKQQQKSYVDISTASRNLLRKAKGKAKGRVLGDGVNAGIVLNLPGQAPLVSGRNASRRGPTANGSGSTTSPAAGGHSRSVDTRITLAATRPRRATNRYSSHFRAARADAVGCVPPADSSMATAATRRKSSAAATTSPSKKKRKRYTQEELLLEAANETEPENLRWLLGRKRIQDQSERDKEAAQSRENRHGKIIERYTSRRGYVSTITFPEMDHIPTVLTLTTAPQPPPVALCVITGLPARYKDPVTGHPYRDRAAFRELRRRHDAGLPLAKVRGDVASTNHNSNTLHHPNRPRVLQTSTKIGKPVVAVTANNHTNGAAIATTPTMTTAPTAQDDTTATLKKFMIASTETPQSVVTPTTPIRKDSVDTTISAASAASSTQSRRTSPRRWKPSAKVLEHMAVEDGAPILPPKLIIHYHNNNNNNMMPRTPTATNGEIKPGVLHHHENSADPLKMSPKSS